MMINFIHSSLRRFLWCTWNIYANFLWHKDFKQSFMYRDIYLKKSYENHSIMEKWVNAHIHILFFVFIHPKNTNYRLLNQLQLCPPFCDSSQQTAPFLLNHFLFNYSATVLVSFLFNNDEYFQKVFKACQILLLCKVKMRTCSRFVKILLQAY